MKTVVYEISKLTIDSDLPNTKTHVVFRHRIDGIGQYLFLKIKTQKRGERLRPHPNFKTLRKP